MMLIHPAADIPIVQVSVLSDENPESHTRMGKALSRLADSNVAIIGSGFASFHNLGLFRKLRFNGAAGDPAFPPRNIEWSCAVTAAASEADPEKREKKFAGWREWPNAYEMHPRGGAEHFLPLIVAAGAGDGMAAHYADDFMGLGMYTYYWA